jgi:hypothetical protein
MKLWNRKRVTFTCALAATLAAAGAATSFEGCGSSTSPTAVSYATTDPYVYYSSYPADVAVASVYWADTWTYTTLYALTEEGGHPGATTMSFDAGAEDAGAEDAGATPTDAGAATLTAGVVTNVGDAIRALARGEAVCPSQVSVTPKLAAPACTGGPASERAGVTLVFTGCQTPGGGTIDGTIDVTSTRTASTASCTSSTTITLSHTTTISNLGYRSPAGARIVIPTQVDTGTNTYMFGQAPVVVSVNTTGRLQTFSANGALTSDHDFTGAPSISFAGTTSGYAVDGAFMALDNLNPGRGLSLTIMGLQRASTCCRPVGGSVQAVQTSGSTATHTWTFGPACGAVTIDGQTTTALPACL